MRKRKAERVLSDTVGYYHRSKLCCLGILSICHIPFIIVINKNILNIRATAVKYDCMAVYGLYPVDDNISKLSPR